MEEIVMIRRPLRSLRVTKVYRGEIPISVRVGGTGPVKRPSVWTGEDFLGFAAPGVTYPDRLRAVTVILDDGTSFKLMSEKITVLRQREGTRFWPPSGTWQFLSGEKSIVGIRTVSSMVPFQDERRNAQLIRERRDARRRGRRPQRSKRRQWYVWTRTLYRLERLVSWKDAESEESCFKAVTMGSPSTYTKGSIHVDFQSAWDADVGSEIVVQWEQAFHRRTVLVEWYFPYQERRRHPMVRLNLSEEEARQTYNSWVRMGRPSGKYDNIHELVEVITNGELAFPIERPSGIAGWNDWHKIHFASGITAINWPVLLRAIEDKYFDQINTNDRLRQMVSTRKTIERDPGLVDRVKRALLAGSCFEGQNFDTEFDVEVCVGARLLFSGRVGGKKIWIVDSPNYGHAMYVFDKEDSARFFANYQISSSEAQEDAIARVIHSDGWEQRATEVLKHAS